MQITIDVERRMLSVPEIGVEVEFPLDDFTQYRLVEGLDDIGLTLRNEDKITAYENPALLDAAGHGGLIGTGPLVLALRTQEC